MWFSGTRQKPGRAWQTEQELGLKAHPAHFLIFSLTPLSHWPQMLLLPVPATAGFQRAKGPAHGTAGTMQAKGEDPDSHQLPPGISPHHDSPFFSGDVWPITQWLAQELSAAPGIYGSTLLLGSDFSKGSFFFSLSPVLSVLTPGSFQPVTETPGAPQPQGVQPLFPGLVSPVCAFHLILSCPKCQLT